MCDFALRDMVVCGLNNVQNRKRLLVVMEMSDQNMPCFGGVEGLQATAGESPQLMGKFYGHSGAGIFLMVFGIRWTFAAINRYFQSLNVERKKPYFSKVNASCYINPKIPLEGIAILSVCSILSVGHSIYGLTVGKLWKEAQHIAAYYFYGLFGLISILKFYRYPLPPSSDYAALIVASCMETIIFTFHIHGRTDIDIHVHVLLVIITAAGVLVTFNEASQRTCVVWSLARGILFTLQGGWYVQVAFALYNPYTSAQIWDENDHTQVQKAMNVFTFHVAMNLLFPILVGSKVWMRLRNKIDFKNNLASIV